MNKRIAVIFLPLALSIGAVANAEDSETYDWKVVGNWDIRVDPTVNNGCFMIASYTRGDIFRLGFDRQNSNGYLMIANGKWTSLVPGNSYPISLQFDSDSPWTGNAAARVMGAGLRTLMVSFSTPDVMKDLATKGSLKVFYGPKLVTELPLTGSSAAVDELVKCQDSVDTYTRTHPPANTSPSDPFATAPSTQSDPFAQ